MTKPSQAIPLVLYENRYCNQEEFDVVICGGRNHKCAAESEVCKLKGPEFQSSVLMSRVLSGRNWCKSAVIGTDIYVLYGHDECDGRKSSFEMYSAKKKHLKTLKPIHFSQFNNSVCTFMKAIYIVGGSIEAIYSEYHTNEVYKYEISENEWHQVASLQSKRSEPACTVFEGKIVVSGGIVRTLGDLEILRSVESYDHHVNKWTFISNMVKAKFGHFSVSMGNKMFVVGRNSLTRVEVFDSVSRQFTMTTLYLPRTRVSDIKAFGVNDKIYIITSEFYMYVFNINENILTLKGKMPNRSLNYADLLKYPKL